MLNIEAALFPGAVPIDGQIVPDTNALIDSSPDAGLFSMVLATEAEKIMPNPETNFSANIDEIPLMGLTVPTEQTNDEMPDAGPSSKNPDRQEGTNYLLLLPFFAFSTNDPLWQNLPKRENPAGPMLMPNAAKTDPNCVNSLVAGSAATTPLALAPTETNIVATISSQEAVLSEKNSESVEGNGQLAIEGRETTTTAENEAKAPAPDQTLQKIFPNFPPTPTQTDRQPVQTATAQPTDSAPQLGAALSSASGPRVFEDKVSSAGDVKTAPPSEGRLAKRSERLEKRGSDNAVETLSEQKASPNSGSAVTGSFGASQHGNPNGDAARHGQTEVDLQITVRPAAKGSSPLSDLPVAQNRPELKGRQFDLDVRSEGLVHDVTRQTVEPLKAQDPVASMQSQHWSQIEKTNVISQLMEKARALRWDRNTEIVVSLKPESLGRISMRAFLVDRTMVAMIATESDKVRQLLQVEIPAIQRSLHESGIPARVLVSQQSDLSFDYSSAGNGQSRYTASTPDASLRDDVDTPTPSNPEVIDSRYLTHSVHLIA